MNTKKALKWLSIFFGMLGALLAYLSVFSISGGGLDVALSGGPAAGINDSLARLGFASILISFFLQIFV